MINQSGYYMFMIVCVQGLLGRQTEKMSKYFSQDNHLGHSFQKTRFTQDKNRPRFVKKKFSQAYSHFVNLMKFLLPIAAFCLLFLVFLWPNLDTDKLKFLLGFAAINFEIGNQPSMINPRYHAADEENQRYSVTANLAKRISKNQNLRKSEIIKLEMPKADIMMKDGTWLVLTAKSGIFLKKEQRLDLIGTVNLFHDSGFEVKTQEAQIDLKWCCKRCFSRRGTWSIWLPKRGGI